MSGYRVAVVGATGNVGREILNILAERQFPLDEVAAVASDWPGLERGAKTGEAAIERLLAYLPRYAQVAKLAEMAAKT